jgi:hypothetical protein
MNQLRIDSSVGIFLNGASERAAVKETDAESYQRGAKPD